MITTFYIIKTILIYFYSLGFSLDTRPHKRQRFNHHRVEIKVVVLYCIVNAPFVILNTSKEENIHFAASRRIRTQTERTISR